MDGVSLTRQVVVNGETRSEPFNPKYLKVNRILDWIKTTIESETDETSPSTVHDIQDGGNVMRSSSRHDRMSDSRRISESEEFFSIIFVVFEREELRRLVGSRSVIFV